MMAADQRLLEPGWAGQLTIKEAEFIAAELAQSSKLRRSWHITKRKRYSLQLIAEKAFPEDPASGRQIMENLLSVRAAARRHPERPGRGRKRVAHIATEKVEPVQLILGKDKLAT